MSQAIFIALKEGEELTGIVHGFKNYGYETVCVHKGEEVLSQIKHHKHLAAILLNSSLEGGNSLELCRELADYKKTAGIPIFILQQGHVDHRPYLELGVDEFLERPLNISLILQQIKANIAAREKAGVKVAVPVKKQMVIVIAALICFLLLFSYFIFYPMILGLRK